MNWPLFLSPAQRASLIANLVELYAHGRTERLPEAERISEVLGHPSMDLIDPDEVRARLQELLR